MKLFKELFYVFQRKQRWQFFGLFFLSLIQTCLDFFGVSMILPFVNVLVNAETLKDASWYRWIAQIIGSDSISSVLLFLTLVLIAVYIVKNVYMLLIGVVRVRFLSTNQIRMGARMINCYMHKPYTFHLQRNTSEIIRNINSDVGGAFAVIAGIFTLISSGLITIALTVYLFAVDVGLTLIVIFALLICSVVYFLLVRGKVRSIGKENRATSAKMIKAIQQSMGGIKEVKVMGREKYFSDVYVDAGTEFVKRQQKSTILSAIPSRMIETLCICGVLGIIALKISNGSDLTAVVPSLSAFAVAAIRLMPQANTINSAISTITYNLPSLESLYEDLTESDRYEAEQNRIIAEKKAKHANRAVAKDSDIILKDISYTYPNNEKPVLEHVDLTIRHGTSVGIVGVTGAGKTTLVDIILGLLDPQEGTVHYGALDIHEDYAEWQRHIGYIPQNIYLIDDTIRNNVAMGIPEDEIDDAAVWKALENAQIAPFVRGLKDGLDTVIGERGVRISGGQRQRIGIARSLYYDPEILFFDEATSSLDSETESAVMESINKLSTEKTMIIVAHRLTTIENCDEIYRVEDGKVFRTHLE